MVLGGAGHEGGGGDYSVGMVDGESVHSLLFHLAAERLGHLDGALVGPLLFTARPAEGHFDLLATVLETLAQHQGGDAAGADHFLLAMEQQHFLLECTIHFEIPPFDSEVTEILGRSEPPGDEEGVEERGVKSVQSRHVSPGDSGRLGDDASFLSLLHPLVMVYDVHLVLVRGEVCHLYLCFGECDHHADHFGDL